MNNIAIMVSDTKYNNIITKTVEYFTKSEKASARGAGFVLRLRNRGW